MRIEVSDRLKKLPPYLFAEIDKLKKEARQQGRDIIDLGVGDPDIPTPDHIIAALQEAAKDPANHKYALDFGLDVLRQAIAGWYKRRFNVDLNPQTEILPLLGSKEGIAHIPVGFINRGDVVLHTEPCYPPYRTGTILAGGLPFPMPLLEQNDFLPCLDAIPRRARKKAKLMFINYPNNPTAATAEKDFLKGVLEWALKNQIIVCNDLAYSEVSYDGYKPSSMLEIEGAKEAVVEFHSLSKTYNMTGWRVGWACGNEAVISALSKVKSNIDSGIFQAVQHAGVAALEGPQDCVASAIETYRKRRDTLVDGLNNIGWKVTKPKAAFYIWTRVPGSNQNSSSFAMDLLQKADVIATPGVGFGPSGEGFIRMALTVSEERIKEAVSRISSL